MSEVPPGTLKLVPLEYQFATLEAVWEMEYEINPL